MSFHSASGLSSRGREEINQLIRTVKGQPGLHCINALKKLWEFAERQDYQEILCHPSFQLLSTLRWVLDTFQGDEIIKVSTGILWYLSRHPANRYQIGCSEAKIIPVIMRKARTHNPAYEDHIIALLSNLCLEDRIHPYLLTRDFGFFDYYVSEINRRPQMYQLYKTIAGFAKCATNSSIEILIESGIHVLILNQLSSASTLDVTQWEGNSNGPLSWCLSFAAAFSSISSGARAIRQCNCVDLFIQLMNQPYMEGVEAAMILANVYGKDESSVDTRAILISHTMMLPLLIDLLDISINYSETSVLVNQYRAERRFVFGIIHLRDLTAALKHLSISDTNKAVMMEETSRRKRLLLLICQLMKSFIEEQDEQQQMIYGSFKHLASVGGGGKDYDTIENVLELLVQLSFFYEDDDSLQDEIMMDLLPRYHLHDMLVELVRLPNARKLPYEAKKYCLTLLSRLEAPRKKPAASNRPPTIKETEEEEKEETEQKEVQGELVHTASIERDNDNSNDSLTPTPRLQRSASSWILQRMTSTVNLPTQRHIMLSYSWAKNKHLVIALGRKLRDLGYDVWRDEEGSTILPPMTGDIVEAMAEAIQYSYMIIICVSPEYKESINCRAEAKYARTRQQRHGLKIAYVMMDENYHTNSSPQVVDGWLGFMIGADLWYPLWHSDQLDRTSTALAELIGDNAKGVPGTPLMRASSGTLNSGISTDEKRENLPIVPPAETLTPPVVSPVAPLATVADVIETTPATTTLVSNEERVDVIVHPSSAIAATTTAATATAAVSPSPLSSTNPTIITPTATLPATVGPTNNIGSGEVDYELAWLCLQPMKSKDPAVLTALLDELGVYCMIDFKGVEPEYYEQIAVLLKPAPQKNFRTATKLL